MRLNFESGRVFLPETRSVREAISLIKQPYLYAVIGEFELDASSGVGFTQLRSRGIRLFRREVRTFSLALAEIMSGLIVKRILLNTDPRPESVGSGWISILDDTDERGTRTYVALEDGTWRRIRFQTEASFP